MASENGVRWRAREGELDCTVLFTCISDSHTPVATAVPFARRRDGSKKSGCISPSGMLQNGEFPSRVGRTQSLCFHRRR